MSARVDEIDVTFDTVGLDVPCCRHGPALLFIKYTHDREGDTSVARPKRFFACSAFRDRKQCNFFQLADEKISVQKKEDREKIYASSHKYSHEQFEQRLAKILRLKSAASFCHTCDLLLLPGEETDHTDHQLKENISKQMLQSPSELFKPLDDNKTYAQYLFSKTAVTFIVDSVAQIGATHVLCIGAPRIHETLLQRCFKERKMESLLLDLDSRYMQVYPSSKFCRFNMFNNHFFCKQGKERTYESFIKPVNGKKVVVVTDPPFGGMVDALAETMKQVLKDCLSDGEASVPILWIFPYFLEKRIVGAMPILHMTDYKVGYDNHSLFSGHKQKKGSPVRIFTNLTSEQFPLPTKEGYRWCSKCLRYSAAANKHCMKCRTCPSKDGSSYVHCGPCGRCVKPSWRHCKTCATCKLQDHKCGTLQSAGCHICGASDHKRRDCQQKNVPARKRKLVNDSVVVLSKKRKATNKHKLQKKMKHAKKK